MLFWRLWCSIMLDAPGVSHTAGLLLEFLYVLFPCAETIDEYQMSSHSFTLPQSILRISHSNPQESGHKSLFLKYHTAGLLFEFLLVLASLSVKQMEENLLE